MFGFRIRMLWRCDSHMQELMVVRFPCAVELLRKIDGHKRRAQAQFNNETEAMSSDAKCKWKFVQTIEENSAGTDGR
jgi:hypothetical protein